MINEGIVREGIQKKGGKIQKTIRDEEKEMKIKLINGGKREKNNKKWGKKNQEGRERKKNKDRIRLKKINKGRTKEKEGKTEKQ